jgi:two-component system cell cycle sensor histidine kinase/response regulator CckA
VRLSSAGAGTIIHWPMSPNPSPPAHSDAPLPQGPSHKVASLHRAGDQLLETVFEQAPLGMVLFDGTWDIVRANTAFAEMLRIAPDALVGRSLVDITHLDDRERSNEALGRLLRRDVTWVTVQQRCVGQDGLSRWGEFAIRIFWGPTGEFLHALGIVRDVSESVRAETALRESEIRNWRIAESNMMGLFEWRDDVTISEANDAFLQMVGYTRDDLRAGRILWSDIIPPGSTEIVQRLREELLVTGRIRPTRMDYRTKGGTRVPVLAGGARISWEPIRGIGFVLDMSEQRNMEDQRARVEVALRDSLAELKQAHTRLQLADRLASMGTLAAGVAHEINNPLAFVVANLGFAQEELGILRATHLDPLELDRRLGGLGWALGEAQEGAARVRNIVLDLKTFSHPDAEYRGPVDICRVIDSAVNLAQGEIRGRARIIRRFGSVPSVLGNEARLSQLFLNLLVNAAHSIPAVPEAPALVGVDAAAPAAPALHEIRLVVASEPDGGVTVEVGDTGAGIAPEHLSKIFDPFFTTKPVGFGTGLGLSICHGIVRSLGGEIGVTSILGAGTTFRIWLPTAPGLDVPVEAAHVASVAAPPHPARRARVLVVDDEPLMGSAIQRVLAEHDVFALTSGRAALSLVRAGQRFDVILCDVMMPEFSGMDLYEGIARDAPDLLHRVVFVTGGAYTVDATAFLDRVPNLRLEKPLSPQALHEAVAQMLEATDPSNGVE